jgi:eukaryotic-like serine/threonine-protein kinase
MALDSKTRFLLLEIRETLQASAERRPVAGTIESDRIEDESILEGCRLHGYEFGRLLGVGSSGSVFEVINSDGIECAVKVMHKPEEDETNSLSLFKREVGIGQAIDHPAVLKTLEAHEKGRARFLFMERVVGSTLRDVMEKPLAVGLFLRLFRPVAEGLQAAHFHGVVHRDLKPENIMVRADGAVKLLDFGLARWAQGQSLTKTNQFKGTISYCAPEQVTESRTADRACDQFAFGLLCFEALTGRLPYSMANPNPLLNLLERVEQPAQKVREVDSRFSKETESVLAKMLERDPADRYSDVELAFASLAQSLR